MASELITSTGKPRGFLTTPSYLRLWFAGGIGNAMRWLELLVAGIFTYEVTHSTVLVALVTVARSKSHRITAASLALQRQPGHPAASACRARPR